MGHHINSIGKFQSDKHPDLKPDRILLSFKDPQAWSALAALAESYHTVDPELSDDIRTRIRSIRIEQEA